MKITRCKYGHYYDKEYFRECPHCYRARGGRDEDIIIERTGLSTDSTTKNSEMDQMDNGSLGKSQTEKNRENVKRWIGEAWDELEEILDEGESYSKNQDEEGWEDIHEEKDTEDFMLLSAMPLKVIKNQEFCMDFCVFREKEWETGAKMLTFKSQESIRDLKPVRMHLPANAVLHILYKDEEILSKEIEIDTDRKSIFCTFPVTVTDTRDRRFHMIKVIFEVSGQGVEVPLYLMPNP